MGITLQQIADLAGTTKSTVDKVIHNRPGVSEKKRQEIKKLLEEYGYEANPLAKALNYQKRKMKVAVVLPSCVRIFRVSTSRWSTTKSDPLMPRRRPNVFASSLRTMYPVP